MHNVETVGHCAELLRMGIANRITSATTMNAHSSRSVSNLIFLVHTFEISTFFIVGWQEMTAGISKFVELYVF